MRQYATYIMGNERPTLYMGITNNLLRRALENKNDKKEGFTKRYKLYKFLYFETGDFAMSAIVREKQIKHMSQTENIDMITENNPHFRDFFPGLTDEKNYSKNSAPIPVKPE